MKKMHWGNIVLFGIICFPLAAENLIFNSGFELGTSGFHCIKYLRPETNPDLVYEGAVADSGDAFAGRYSLRIPNRFAETVNLLLPEMCLEPDTEYTLSFQMKSGNDQYKVTASVVSAPPEGKWDVAKAVFLANREWKRYEMRFRTAAGTNRNYLISFLSCFEASAAGADLWLDNLRLCKGSANTWTPSKPVEIAVIPAANYFTGALPVDCPLEVIAVNHTDSAQTVSLNAELIPDHSGSDYRRIMGTPIALPNETVTLEPHEKRSVKTVFRAERFGAFRTQTEQEQVYSPGSFAVIGIYKRRPIDINRDFCVSLGVGSGGIVAPPRWGETVKGGFRAANGGPEALWGALSDMGCRLIRDWGYPQSAQHWRLIQPEEDRFDFSVMDKTVEIMRQYDMHFLPVLGGSDTHNSLDRKPHQGNLEGLPAWLLERSKAIPAPQWLLDGGKGLFLPEPEYWRAQFRAIAQRYKDVLTHYEIMNEPNLCMDAEQYAAILKIAHEEIRAANPRATIVGICSTGDLGGSMARFIEKSLELNAGHYLDAISFHPYNAPALGSATPADGQISRLKAILERFQLRNTPVWNTELYFLRGEQKNQFERSIVHPEDAATRFLTDLGEGLRQSISLRHGEMFQSVTPHTATSVYGVNQFVPNANFVAYNALARYFEAAEPVGKWKFNGNVVCYAYRKGGELIAAVWHYGSRSDVKIDLTGFRVMDLYGNPESAGEVRLGASPWYLQPGTLSDNAFLERCAALKVTLDKAVAAGHLARRCGDRLFVNLFNESEQLQVGKAGVQGGGLRAVRVVDFSIPAQSRIVLEIPVKETEKGDRQTELILAVASRMERIPIEVEHNKFIPKVLRMPNAEGTLEFSDDEIILTLRVSDSTNAGPSGNRKPWETDSVELFFDPDPLYLPQSHARRYTPDTFRLFILPRDGKFTAQGKIDLGKCRLNIREEKDGYSFTLVIPALEGEFLGFDMKINDFDGAKVLESTLSGGEKLHENRCRFGLVEKGEKE